MEGEVAMPRDGEEGHGEEEDLAGLAPAVLWDTAPGVAASGGLRGRLAHHRRCSPAAGVGPLGDAASKPVTAPADGEGDMRGQGQLAEAGVSRWCCCSVAERV